MDKKLKNSAHADKFSSTFYLTHKMNHLSQTNPYPRESQNLSKPDYCQSLLWVTSDYQKKKMHYIQDMTCHTHIWTADRYQQLPK